jgi:hypothetical protein
MLFPHATQRKKNPKSGSERSYGTAVVAIPKIRAPMAATPATGFDKTSRIAGFD